MPPDSVPILCVDIGSTRTKAALFTISGSGEQERVSLTEREETDTIPDRIDEGLFSLLDRPALQGRCREVRVTSSAHGGLSMVVVGLVPDLTVHVAREAALSAGARLTGSYSYLLTKEDREQLEAGPPDIILLTGGTDGGHTRYILENARTLSRARLPETVVIYAGNRCARAEAVQILFEKDLLQGKGVAAVIALDNLLPTLEEPRVDHVQQAIREIFLNTIIKGKGLDRVVRRLVVEPEPTPHAVLGLVRSLWEQNLSDPQRTFCLVDLGGATTDWYSAAPAVPAGPHTGVGDDLPTVLRGIEEPVVRRTVEADLGMRVSAAFVPEALGGGEGDPEFIAYCKRVSQDIAYLPRNRQESEFDQRLAGACLTLAAKRHSGHRRAVFTPEGTVYLQHGKDLRSIPTIIATGGALARLDRITLPGLSPTLSSSHYQERLVPDHPRIIKDREYLIPLLAPLAPEHPAAVARYVRETLTTELSVTGSFRQMVGSYGGVL